MRAAKRFQVIVLAAGKSRRLGRDKALLEWGPTTLMEHVLSAFSDECASRVIVVANPSNQAALRAVIGAGVDLTVNPDADADMLSSIRCGIDCVDERGGALCIHPVDVFAVTVELVTYLHERWRASPEQIHLPTVGGRGGHPLIVPTAFIPAIRGIEAGGGLRRLLSERPREVARHAWSDERLLLDVDSVDNYSHYRPVDPSDRE